MRGEDNLSHLDTENRMKITKIDSLSSVELGPYRTMRRPIEHREKGVFIAEGEKVVRRLVDSKLNIVSLLMTPEWAERYSPLLEGREIRDGLYLAEKKLLEEIVGYGLHQGIMAIGEVPPPALLGGLRRSDGRPFMMAAADGVANSENMGVIVRNCSAFGADALIIGETSCDPYLRRSVRNSMGTIFQLPILYTDDLASVFPKLKEKYGVRVIGAHPRPDSEPLSKLDLTHDVCFVFGSEGAGISSRVLDVCDSLATIPMHNEVDSVNVGSSVGIVLYECRRQRTINIH